MRKLLPASLRGLLISGLLLLLGFSSYASHIVGAQLTYKWVSCNTYTVEVDLYGDCGSASVGSFNTLPISHPQVCVYDGGTLMAGLTLNLNITPSPSCGVEVTPVCPDSLAYTQCTNTAYSLPGIKKFVYVGTCTLPHASSHWRFIYTGYNGGMGASPAPCTGTFGAPAMSGRACAITNISTGASCGTTEIQLIDTLNNSPTNTRGNNSSPILTVEPVPYFCAFYENCYNPGAVDLYDVGPGEPSGDSLLFRLIPSTDGTATCGSIGGPSVYVGTYCGATAASGSHPLSVEDCTPASFSFDSSTGQLCFKPLTQRSVVVYNIEEYRNDTEGTISTIADVLGTAGFTGDLGAAAIAHINGPSGICTDTLGNIYFSDYTNNRVRVISPLGIISTYAGNGTPGYAGDAGAAISAELNGPKGLAVSQTNGNLYIADFNNNAIRMVTPTGTISTITNVGALPGFGGDGGPAAVAQLTHPNSVCLDTAGNIYITDAGNARVREIDHISGNINTIAGNGTSGYTGDGTPATAWEVNNPYGLCADRAGNIYVADELNNRVRKITPGGASISTIAGTAAASYTGDNCAAAGATFKNPTDVVVDTFGNIFISDMGNAAIREIYASSGIIETVVGTGTAGFSGDGSYPNLAAINSVQFFNLDPAGNMYISDYGNNRVRTVAAKTELNHVLVGSMQREMTFYVKLCDYTEPSGEIDTFSGSASRYSPMDSTHVIACQYSGNFNLDVNPKETDTSLHITITASGLTSGFTFAVDSDNTNHPHGTVTGNTSIITPGNYTFYLTYTDNHCPLVGTKTVAFSVTILPVPSISDIVVTPATCDSPAVIKLQPGGTGKPWTIKISGGRYSPLDTFRIYSLDTVAISDTFSPPQQLVGDTAHMTIFTSISNQCHVDALMYNPVPNFKDTAIATNPTYCGGNTGSILIEYLAPFSPDILTYRSGGVDQPPVSFIASAAGTYTLNFLRGGIYDSIVVHQNNCFTPASKDTLVDPPFKYRTVTSSNPTKCGFCDGVDTLWGLHPGQVDTIEYTKTTVATPPVTTTFTTSHLIASDSMVVFTGLCQADYTNIVVHTAGVCADSIFGPFSLRYPLLTIGFDTATLYGCKGDTIVFTNHSGPAADLTYHWLFSDGESSTDVNPRHVFTDISDDSVRATLVITNSVCVDSMSVMQRLDNFVHANFSFTPNPFVCQDSLVTFTNLSTGTDPKYTWYFGDGVVDKVDVNPTHTFLNTGTQHTITLVAHDFVPCYDTMTKTIDIDSISSVLLLATDSVLCSGQGITFSGDYSRIGNTGITWSFGDGGNVVNVEPVIHSYENAGVYTITVSIQYRSCPVASASRQVQVFGYPNIYLGPDTAMCPGGAPLMLLDGRNNGNPLARWKWSTGDSTAGITVTKPGTYSVGVTTDGCVAYDTVVVLNDCYMELPNVFSPNGDGVNDFFFPRQILTRGVISFKMDIYNRWGQLIYETTNTDGRGWDGNFNDQKQPEGVYVYLIDATFKDGTIEHHQGNVTLLR